MMSTTIAKDPENREVSLVRRPVSTIWRTNVYALYIIISIAAIVYSDFEKRTFLSDRLTDGFTSQVMYIWNYIDGKNSLLDLDPLLWIHALRALIAYVFVEIEDFGGSAAVTTATLLLTVPILNTFSHLRRGYLVIALPIATMFLSPRTILVVISVAYLILYMNKRRGILYLIVSFILTNLSSGAVMNNVFISSTVIRNHRKSTALYIYISLLAISLLISASDKYEGFTEQKAGYNSTVYGATGLWAILSRSTIYISALNADYIRLAGYVTLAAVALAMIFFTLRSRQYRGYSAIMLSAIPSLAFEGLGFMSLLVPILLLLAGGRLPWHPRNGDDND